MLLLYSEMDGSMILLYYFLYYYSNYIHIYEFHRIVITNAINNICIIMLSY